MLDNMYFIRQERNTRNDFYDCCSEGNFHDEKISGNLATGSWSTWINVHNDAREFYKVMKSELNIHFYDSSKSVTIWDSKFPIT